MISQENKYLVPLFVYYIMLIKVQLTFWKCMTDTGKVLEIEVLIQLHLLSKERSPGAGGSPISSDRGMIESISKQAPTIGLLFEKK